LDPSFFCCEIANHFLQWGVSSLKDTKFQTFCVVQTEKKGLLGVKTTTPGPVWSLSDWNVSSYRKLGPIAEANSIFMGNENALF
jgi:hypothetical protein